MTKPPRDPQSGFAMLLVFALAAILAISLYQQLPRAAFEAQRDKEQLLIDHGEQYKRAVQLYVRKLGRYPAKIEDLDNTQNIRYLRKHYIDPMTGKDEWRLLHMGPAGKLIDSKIQADDPNKDQWHAGSITEFKSPIASENGDGGPEAINLATRHRASDDQALPAPGGNSAGAPANTDPNGNALNSPPTAGASGIPGGAAANPNLPGMPPGFRGSTNPTGATANPSGGNGGFGSSVSGNGGYGSSVSGNGGYGTPAPTPANTGQPPQNGQPPQYGQPVNSQYQGQSPTSYPTATGSNQPGAPGFQNPGQTTGNSPFGAGGQGSPAQMINNLLTSPRPGGAPSGLPGIGGSVMGGLAGVASTHKGHGIKHYGDQDEYQKWEFYYDLSKELAATTPGAAPANPNGTPLNGVGTPPNGFNPATGGSAGGGAGSFGSSGGLGGSAFGAANPTGAPPPPPPPPSQ